MKLLYDPQDIQNAQDDLKADLADDLASYNLRPAAIADLCTEARTCCRRKPLHTVHLWVVVVDAETQSTGYHARLTLEWITRENSDTPGDLYPSLDMAGVWVDDTWSSALYAAKQHFPVPESADVRWTVQFVNEPAVGSDIRYATTLPRNAHQELVGRSAGASFLIGLCALHHRALRKPVTLQEEVDILARIVPLVVLPNADSDGALAKLEGGEQAKLKALERHLANLTLISSDTENTALPANTIRVSTVARLIREIEERLYAVDQHLDQLRAHLPTVSKTASPPNRRWPIYSWFQSREKHELQNRSRMIERMQTYWIDGFLHQALNEVNQFNVGYELRPGAVLRAVDFKDLDLSPETDFAEIFNIVGSEVLILGAPGSGKTILLLQLAKTLLDRARKDQTAKIPIVLNLSSWAKKQEPLDEWIVSDASVSYQLPRKVIRRWVDEGQLIPLLDGLDEVSARARATTADDAQLICVTDKDHSDVIANRIACLESINEFRCRFSDTPIAVCSRIADYDNLHSKLDLRFAILQKPLDDCQVHGVTSREEMAGLRAILTQETWLQNLCRVPFMLNAVSYAYADEPEPKLRLAEPDRHKRGRERHIIDTYISKRLEVTRSARLVSSDRLRYLLSWLANRIEGSQSIFHMESLQIDALSRFHPRWIFCYASRLIFSLVALVSITVVFTLLARVGIAAFRYEPTSDATKALLKNSNDVKSTLGLIWLPLITFYIAGHGAAIFEWAQSFSFRRPLVACFRLSVIALTSAVLFHIHCFSALVHAAVNEGIFHLSQNGQSQSSTSDNVIATTKELHIWLSEDGNAFFEALVPVYRHAAIGFGWFMCLSAISALAWRSRNSERLTIYAALLGPVLIAAFVLPDLTASINFFGTGDGPWYAIRVWTFLALLLGLFMAMTAFFSNRIEASERIKWSWNWTASLAFGAAPVVMFWLVSSSSNDRFNGQFFSAMAMMAIFGGVVFGFGRQSQIQVRTRPNQGVQSSLRMGLLMTVIFFVGGFISALIVTPLWANFTDSSRLPFGDQLLNGSYNGFRFGTFMAAVGSIIGGFDVPIKHYLLRVLLWITERIPLRLQRFLDSCVHHLMLRRVGGGYIFVHRYLLERFAELRRQQSKQKSNA